MRPIFRFSAIVACLILSSLNLVFGQDAFDVSIDVASTTPGANIGSITLTPTGGVEPYVYNWEEIPGHTSNVATGLGVGSYKITITDDLDSVVERVVGVGYEVEWKPYNYMTYADGVVQGTSTTSGWNRTGASSIEVLLSGSDGWLEYTIENKSEGKMFGFWKGASDPYRIANLSYGFNIGGQSIYVWLGNSSHFLGQYEAGDVLRVERENGKIHFMWNGTTHMSVDVDQQEELRGMVTTSTVGAKFTGVRSSFNNKALKISTTVQGINTTHPLGRIHVEASEGGGPAYSYEWIEGVTGNIQTIENLSKGNYKVKITDGEGRVEYQRVGIGYEVEWKPYNYMTYADGVVQGTSTTSGWNRTGASSIEVLLSGSDGWLEYTIENKSEGKMFGFWKGASDPYRIANLSYGFNIGGQSIYVWLGNSSHFLGQYEAGDVLRVERENGKIHFMWNGTTHMSVDVDQQEELRGMVTTSTVGAKFTGVRSSFNNKALKISTTVQGINTTHPLGRIHVEASEGGGPAYSYEWIEGVTGNIQTIENLSKGNYKVKITDGEGRVEYQRVGIGYEVEWKPYNYMTYADGVVQGTSTTSGWNRTGASSIEVLLSGSDGWLEYTIENKSEGKMFGFWKGASDPYRIANLSYGFNIGGQSIYVWLGNSSHFLGQYEAGDVLRVERENGKIHFMWNGTTHMSVDVDQQEELRGMVTTSTVGAKFTGVRSSFNNKALKISTTVQGINTTHPLGRIHVEASEGGGPAYSYEWIEGVTGNIQTIENLSKGNYKVKITDGEGRVEYQRVGIGYEVEWKPYNYMTYADGVVQGTSTTSGWNRTGASSIEVLLSGSDGWLEYTIENKSEGKMFGFWKGASDPYRIANLSYGFNIGGQSIYVWLGNSSHFLGQYEAGDVLRVERENGKIHFMWNGTTHMSVDVDQQEELRGMVTTSTVGAKFTGVRSSFNNKALKISTTVQGINTTHPLGRIHVEASEGGGPAYSYEWIEGVTGNIQTIENLSKGNYKVKITDGEGRVEYQRVGIGYEVEWKPYNYMTYADGVVQGTSTTSGWNRTGASSIEVLLSGSDGWLEYTIENKSEGKMFGFWKGASDPYRIANLSYGFNIGGQSIYVWLGNSSHFLGQYEAGDVLRVERENGKIHFMWNGTTHMSVDVDQQEELRGMVTTSTVGAKFTGVRSSFNNKALKISTTVQGINTTHPLGRIHVEASEGGGPAYSYEWIEGVTGNIQTIENLSKGNYKVKITDGEGRVEYQRVGIGYEVEWEPYSYMTYSDGVVQNTNPVQGWDRNGATSIEKLGVGENGWLEYTIENKTEGKMFGFWKEGVSPNKITHLPYGFNIGGQSIYVWYQNTSHFLGQYEAGDVLRVERENGKIHFMWNGTTHMSVDVDQQEEYKGMVIISTIGGKFSGIRRNFGTPLVSNQLTLNFQQLPKTDFSINGPGLTTIEGVSGETSDPYIIQPTAPEIGVVDSVSIHVKENSNDAQNNAAMDLKILYDEDLKIQNVLIVNGANEQELSSSWYKIEEDRKLTFLNEEPKKPLLPITTNLQGVVYDKTGSFEVSVGEPGLFTNKELRVYDASGSLQGTDTKTTEALLQWDGTSATEGLYKFELDLTPNGGALQTFKGQFIVK